MADEEQQPHTTDPTGTEPVSTPEQAPAASEPEGTVPLSRFNELNEELRQVRRTLNTSQLTMQQELAAMRSQQQQAADANPEYANHPFTQWLGKQHAAAQQQIGGVIMNERQRTDRIEARLELDETYGAGTFKKLADDIDAEHQEYLRRGQWMDRKDLGEVLARKRGLTPLSEQRDAETQRARKRAAQSAQVETAPPARRATPPAEKPLKAMTTDELEARLRVEFPNGF